jgi:hypothetical protein
MDDQNRQPFPDTFDPYQELVKDRASELFCDACGHYPIVPVHGHFVCPACKMPTKCCEGMPLDV